MPLPQLTTPKPSPPKDPHGPPEVEEYVEERDPGTGKMTRRRVVATRTATEETSQVTSPSETMVQTKRVIRPSPELADEFGRKKQVFHAQRIVRYTLVFLELLLAFRLLLKLFGADSHVWFAQLIYGLSAVFVHGFDFLFGKPTSAEVQHGYFESSTLVAAIFYALVAWGIVKVFLLKKPVPPSEVEQSLGSQERDQRIFGP